MEPEQLLVPHVYTWFVLYRPHWLLPKVLDVKEHYDESSKYKGMSSNFSMGSLASSKGDNELKLELSYLSTRLVSAIQASLASTWM